jgi:hypothetical protein
MPRLSPRDRSPQVLLIPPFAESAKDGGTRSFVQGKKYPAYGSPQLCVASDATYEIRVRFGSNEQRVGRTLSEDWLPRGRAECCEKRSGGSCGFSLLEQRVS